MKRLHLFEFEDFGLLPSRLRDYVTDYLRTAAEKFGIFDPVIPRLAALAKQNDLLQIVDLASGAGGQWRTLLPQLLAENKDIRLTLTDKFPNAIALKDIEAMFTDVAQVEMRSIDAIEVPPDLKGIRTMFLSLHHFRSDQVEQIFANAVGSGVPIAVFEAQRRDVEHLIRFSLSPIAVLLITPFIRPVNFLRIVFTYLIPLVPLIVFWDGIVSVLRTYSNEELENIAQSIDAKDAYQWSSEVVHKGQQKIQIFIGSPRK